MLEPLLNLFYLDQYSSDAPKWIYYLKLKLKSFHLAENLKPKIKFW